MSTEPLNVRVARAIGWTDVQSIGIRGGVEKWVGIPPALHDAARDLAKAFLAPGQNIDAAYPPYAAAIRYEPIPPYGQDTPEGWSCTGPFLRYVHEANAISHGPAVMRWPDDDEDCEGAPTVGQALTWGEALCNLVLSLAEAGRLR